MTADTTASMAAAGLAAITAGKSKQKGKVSGGDEDEAFSLFTKFGAVEVNGANFLELLKRNETILLFPG